MEKWNGQMEGLVKSRSFFRDRNIIITGHTGFKGSWLTLWLHTMGARITGVSLDPRSSLDAYYAMEIADITNDLRLDINDYPALLSTIKKIKPEIVFHLAAQPLVLESYKDPLYTLNTNIIGTANLLEACRQTSSVKVVLIITTDKVYANTGSGKSFKENDRLGGEDIYSASKASAEIVTRAYRASFLRAENMAVATVRAGNVIGGGDWSENRIIPDCVRAITSGKNLEMRNPFATRPWQHVLEPLRGYLLLAEKMFTSPFEYSEEWNFGPRYEGNKTVLELVNEFIRNWGEGTISTYSEKSEFQEAKLLTLSIDKAMYRLDWLPLLSFQDSVKMTAEWYKSQRNDRSMRDFTINQIKYYEELIS